MKIVTKILIALVAMISAIACSRIYFAVGEVCQKSVPRFNPEKKVCPWGTTCTYKRTPSKEEKGVSKYCMVNPKGKAGYAAKYFKRGEVCAQSSKNFNPEKKVCPLGSECKHKRVVSREEKGVPKYCL